MGVVSECSPCNGVVCSAGPGSSSAEPTEGLGSRHASHEVHRICSEQHSGLNLAVVNVYRIRSC